MRKISTRRLDGVGACAWRFAAALALLAATPASAKDSSAELTTGGLVLAKSADIEMRSEDLAISASEMVVRYRFLNHSAQDVTTTVAFPMLDIVWEGSDTNISVPSPDSPNFLDFRTAIDGQPVAARNEQKAFAKGVDITQRLTALGVPLTPQSDKTWKTLDALKPADQDELVKTEIAILDVEIELFLDPDVPRRARTGRRTPLSPERRRDDRRRGRLAANRSRGGQALRSALLRRQGVHRRCAQGAEAGREGRIHGAFV